MNSIYTPKVAAALLWVSLLSACAQAPRPDAATMNGEQLASDRAAILAMAGTYNVTFDMRETVSLSPDYTLLPPKTSKGTEVVKVVKDTGRIIRLQHILVGKGREGNDFVVKHWRQDWTYEPASVLMYRGQGVWAPIPVAKADSTGVWSQTVWQTDDSPRYGGVGRWRTDNGAASWEARDTTRALARRDAVRTQWDGMIAANNGLALAEDADSGSATTILLMTADDEIAVGKTSTGAAITEAKTIIGASAGKPNAQLAADASR